MLYWILKQLILGPFLRGVYQPKVAGAANVPSTGGAILAGNHLSFSDSFFLPIVVPRRVTFTAKSDYFTGRGLKGWLTAAFFKGVGQIPVDRSGNGAGQRALEAGLAVLREGGLLGIYPEGTRSPDGRLYRGKTGVARLALGARVPVIPVVMVGTRQAQPIGTRIPRLRPISVVFGPALDFSEFYGREDDPEALRAVTDAVMYSILALSGQEYVDEYASNVRARAGKGQDEGQGVWPASPTAPGGREHPTPAMWEGPPGPSRRR